MLNIPNLMTLGRLALLPFIIALLYSGGSEATWIALGLYVVAALTDFFDGYLARKLNQISAFGTFLDPISDKIFVGVLLVALVGFGRLEGLWMIAAFVIIARELLVSGLREFLGPHNVQMPVTKLAKWKTATQMLSLGFLIVGNLAIGALLAGQLLLVLAAALTAITGWAYLMTGLRYMKDMDSKDAEKK